MSRTRIVSRRLVAIVAAAGLFSIGLTTASWADSAPSRPDRPHDAGRPWRPMRCPPRRSTAWCGRRRSSVTRSTSAGKFTTARPAGSAAGVNTVPRSNLLAFSISTGQLLPWAPVADGQVRSITRSPDGSRIYITGDFNKIDGVYHVRIAAFNTATNTIVAGFKPTLAAAGLAVAASNTTVYAGGNFVDRREHHGRHAGPAQPPGGVRRHDRCADAVRRRRQRRGDVAGGHGRPAAGRRRRPVHEPERQPVLRPRRGQPDVRARRSRSRPTTRSVTREHSPASRACTRTPRASTARATTSVAAATARDRSAPTPPPVRSSGSRTATATATPRSRPAASSYVASHEHYCGNMGGFPQTDPWSVYHATAFSQIATGINTAGHLRLPGPPRSAVADAAELVPDLLHRHLHRPGPGRVERHGQQRLRRLRRGVPRGQRRRPAGPRAVRRPRARPRTSRARCCRARTGCRRSAPAWPGSGPHLVPVQLGPRQRDARPTSSTAAPRTRRRCRP